MLCNAKTRRNIPVSSIVCLTGAFGFNAFLALLSHVGAQGFGECRSCYSVPATFAILLGGSIAAHRLLETCTAKKWALPVLASLTTVTLFITIGLPNKSRVEKAYEQRWGYYRDLLIEHECTHIGGASYYSYDIMFYTNYYYYQQGSDKRLYPYTFRDTPFRDAAIQAVDENARIGCILFYDWDYDYYGLNSRRNGIIVPSKAIFKCERFQVHRILKIER